MTVHSSEPRPEADDLDRALQNAAGMVKDHWTAERARQVNGHIQLAGRARPTWQRWGIPMGAALTIATLVWWLNPVTPDAQTQATQPPAATSTATTALSDGSRYELLSDDAHVEVRRMEDAQVDLRLLRGTAVFDVAKKPSRTFSVTAGPVRVEVIGTRFIVERLEHGAQVSVERGKVRVTFGQDEQFLTAGQKARFETASASAGDVDQPADEEPRKQVEPAAAAKVDWRALARSGKHAPAYEVLKSGKGQVRNDDPGDLLLAADAARISGHPAAAVPHLQRVTRQFAADPRAPLAAFTLGRLWLEQLGQPARAASAFALARKLAPSGALAEDALARQVKALSQAGRKADAQKYARDYLKRYPAGHQRGAMLRHADDQ